MFICSCIKHQINLVIPLGVSRSDPQTPHNVINVQSIFAYFPCLFSFSAAQKVNPYLIHFDLFHSGASRGGTSCILNFQIKTYNSYFIWISKKCPKRGEICATEKTHCFDSFLACSTSLYQATLIPAYPEPSSLLAIKFTFIAVPVLSLLHAKSVNYHLLLLPPKQDRNRPLRLLVLILYSLNGNFFKRTLKRNHITYFGDENQKSQKPGRGENKKVFYEYIKLGPHKISFFQAKPISGQLYNYVRKRHFTAGESVREK